MKGTPDAAATMRRLLGLLPFGKIVDVAIGLAAAPLKEWLEERATRRAFTDAVRHTCRAFDARHPDLSEVFFDETFVDSNLGALLAEFMNNRGRLPEPDVIARKWATTYRRDVAGEAVVARAAVDFLHELSRQLAAQAPMQSFLDRAAWDKSARYLQGIEEHTATLSSHARRAEIEDNFDRLGIAASRYESAAEALLDGRPGDAAERLRDARELHQSARRRLERFEYVAVASVLADFDELIVDHYEALVDAIESDPATAQMHYPLLRAGLVTFDGRLRVAP